MAFDNIAKERLANIYQEMVELAHEALDLVARNGTRLEYERAKGYWAGHILGNLGGTDYDFGNSPTLLSQLQDLGYDSDTEKFEDDDDDDSDEEEKNDDNED